MTGGTNGLYSETYAYDPATGNLSAKGGVTYAYSAGHAHAVSSLSNGNTYSYDTNGNQTMHHIGSDTFTLLYDVDCVAPLWGNRLVEVKKNSVTIAQFVYNGDGQKVKSVVNETVYLVNGYYEQKGSQVTKYYFAGATRIAMRKYTVPQSMSVEYFLGDHLESTSITTDANGAKTSELRYTPWGEVRYAWTASLSTTPAYELTKYTYTGQYSYLDDPATAGVAEGFGLMFYNARWYDPSLGRFAQADTIIPTSTQGVQAWDRYAFVNNNPLRYTDPSGHCLIICTAIIGAVVSVAVDYYTTTQINHEQYTVEKALVAATVGAIGGAIGVGIIAPIAELAGATAFAGALWITSPTIATAIGVTAELTAGAVLSATTNVVLSPAHRELDAYFEGEDVTWDSYVDNINEHWTNDAIVGATSYVLSTTVSEGTSTTFYPPQNVTQRIVYSTIQGAGVGLSNTDLLDFSLPDFNRRGRGRTLPQ